MLQPDERLALALLGPLDLHDALPWVDDELASRKWIHGLYAFEWSELPFLGRFGFAADGQAEKSKPKESHLAGRSSAFGCVLRRAFDEDWSAVCESVPQTGPSLEGRTKFAGPLTYEIPFSSVANARAEKKPKDASSEPKPPVPRSPKFTLEFFVDDDGKHLVRDWLRSLSLTKKQVLGQAMNAVLQELGIGVCETQFGKQLGRGLFEFRLRQKVGEVGTGKGGKKLPPEEILLRVFCHAHGDHIVLLLGGYDKGEDPSKKRQNSEIEEARARLKRWKLQQD